MSENLLEALMQLYALLSDIIKEENKGRTRSLVESFLSGYYNKEYVDLYLGKYDFYLNQFQSSFTPESQDQKGKDNAERYLKVLEISRHVKLEMEEEPRLILVGLLLNFLKNDGDVGEEALSFVGIVARELQINEEDFQNIYNFILKHPEDVKDKSVLLLISGKKEVHSMK